MPFQLVVKIKRLSLSGRARRRSAAPADDPRDPGDERQYRGGNNDGPACSIGGFEIETGTGVPGEMTDSVAEMVEQRHGPAEQQ